MATQPSDPKREQYAITVELVEHLDNMMSSYKRFYLTALGTLVPITVLLTEFDVSRWALTGVGILAVTLGLHWASMDTRVGLQKRCLTRNLRELERELFGTDQGPFSKVKKFFDNLRNERVRTVDRLLARQSSGSAFNLIPAVLFVVVILWVLAVVIIL